MSMAKYILFLTHEKSAAVWATLQGTVPLVMAQNPGKNLWKWHLHIKYFHEYHDSNYVKWSTVYSGPEGTHNNSTHNLLTGASLWLLPNSKLGWSQKSVLSWAWRNVSILSMEAFHVSLNTNKVLFVDMSPIIGRQHLLISFKWISRTHIQDH